jgi:hypothetical protein
LRFRQKTSVASVRRAVDPDLMVRRVVVGGSPRFVVAPVALFCYWRSHLEEADLAVAATRDEEELVKAGEHLGRTPFL